MIDSNLMRRLPVTAGFIFLMVAYHSIFHGYYPLPDGLMGHDYALTLASFEDGYLWFRNNGFLTPPWFTPSFCAGQAFFADPQSIFYSVPQFLSFVFNPLEAVYISVLLFAGLGFWGTYLLARRSFGLSAWAAFAAATVFMFNGFYSHRMIVGHFGYQPYMLVPWVAWFLIGNMHKRDGRAGSALSVLSAGLLVAYWLQAGLTTLMVPAGLAVIALGCMAAFRDDAAFGRMIRRGLGATVIALGISASKLAASIALVSHFPRDYYPLPGISDVTGLLTFVFQALFYSSEHAYQTATPLWRNMQWSAMPHELAYGITLVPLLVILIGVGLNLRDRLHGSANKMPTPGGRKAVAVLLAVILMLPLALLYYSPGWNAVLKQLPLIGATTSPFRWMIIYIPVLALLTGLAADMHKAAAKWAVFLCMLGIPVLNALENGEFYKQQAYDPAPVLKYDQAVRNGRIRPVVQGIGLPKNTSGQEIIDNALFTQGMSPLICYNPLFGYRLEKYNRGALHPGDVFDQAGEGHLNFRNPACLVFPGENGCSPWDGFKDDQAEQLKNFVSYRPFDFRFGPVQQLANYLTEATLLASVIALLVLWGVVVKRR